MSWFYFPKSLVNDAALRGKPDNVIIIGSRDRFSGKHLIESVRRGGKQSAVVQFDRSHVYKFRELIRYKGECFVKGLCFRKALLYLFLSFGESTSLRIQKLHGGEQTVKVHLPTPKSKTHPVTAPEAVHAERLSDEIGLLKVAMFPGVRPCKKDNWVGEIGQGFTTVRVAFQQPPVEHEVKMKDLVSWLGRQRRSPAEVMLRQKLEKILGR
jgi:hypothetical protein